MDGAKQVKGRISIYIISHTRLQGNGITTCNRAEASATLLSTNIWRTNTANDGHEQYIFRTDKTVADHLGLETEEITYIEFNAGIKHKNENTHQDQLTHQYIVTKK